MKLRVFILFGLVTVSAFGLTLRGTTAGTTGPFSDFNVSALIAKTLSQQKVEPFSLALLSDVKVLDIDLISQDKLAADIWNVVIKLKADYGPSPAGVIGFQSIRSQHYRLYVRKLGGNLKIDRITPISKFESRSTRY